MPKGILLGQAGIVAGTLLGRNLRERHVLGRRHQQKALGGCIGPAVAQDDGHLAVLAEGAAAEAELSILGGPYHQVAQAGTQEGFAVGVGVFGHGRVELGVVVDAKVYAGIGHRIALGVENKDVGSVGAGVVPDEVDLGVVGALQHHFFRAVVPAERAGVHEHGAGGGGVEPAEVQDGLGLTGAQEPPAAVGPGFYPGVVVVGVGPAGRVHLPGGDADATQGGHQEGRFLPASAQGVLHQVQGRRRAGVRGLIGHLLVAPVVHLQNGILHAQALDAGQQLGLENRPMAIQVLVIHPQRQHKVAEFPLRHVPSPLHGQGRPHIVQVELRGVVGNVGQRHVGVEEGQGLLLGPGQAVRQGHEGRQGPIPCHRTGLIVPLHLGTVFPIGQKVVSTTRKNE